MAQMGRKKVEYAFEILNGRVRHSTEPRASIAALQWAADRAGQSYGIFTQRLTPADEARIQQEFEAYKRERETELARRAQRVRISPDNDEFIITDDDA